MFDQLTRKFLGIFKNSKATAVKYFRNSIELSSDLTDVNQKPDFIKIVPVGAFPTHPDGPHEVTKEHIQQMANNLKNGGTDLMFDFGHASIYCSDAEAAGWSPKDLVQAKDDGLYVKYPEWTVEGQEKVSGRAYRYLSPAYMFNQVDKAGHEIGAVLHSVGLVNKPWMDTEIDAIGNSNSKRKTFDSPKNEETMNPFILNFLGLPATATEADVQSAISNSAVKLGLPATASFEQITAAIEANVKKNSAQITPQQLTDLQTELQGLRDTQAAQLRTEVETFVNSAIERGKLLPALKDQFVNDGVKNFDAIKADLNARADNSAVPGKVKVNGDTIDKNDAKAIADKAQEYINSQASLGKHVGIIDAVNHVTGK